MSMDVEAAKAAVTTAIHDEFITNTATLFVVKYPTVTPSDAAIFAESMLGIIGPIVGGILQYVIDNAETVPSGETIK